MRLFRRLKFFCAFSCAFMSLAVQAQQATGFSRYQDQKREANDIAVSIVVSGLTCTCARFAEDIRNVVNDLRPGGMRVLPILGVGGFQNVNDLLFLRGVDMATVDQDNLKLLKKKDPVLYANLEQRVHFITKLYNAEFHVLARKSVKSIADLRGKKVNFNLKDSQTQVTADNIFNLLKLETIRSHYDNDEAISRLMSGDLDAMIVLTGAPQSAIAKVKKDDGLHIVPIDEESLAGFDTKELMDEYLPAELTNEIYPNLIPAGQTIPTLANRALLAVYNWQEGSDRYLRLAKFVQEFFGKIESFKDKSRHQKWKEINLAADVPGWTRFKPAREWLEGRQVAVAVATPEEIEIKTAFQKFLENYNAASGNKALTATDKEKLFVQFKQFLDAQNVKKAAR